MWDMCAETKALMSELGSLQKIIKFNRTDNSTLILEPKATKSLLLHITEMKMLFTKMRRSTDMPVQHAAYHLQDRRKNQTDVVPKLIRTV